MHIKQNTMHIKQLLETLTRLQIDEGFKEAEAEFSQTADPIEVKNLITQYRQLNDRKQYQQPENNIDYWRKQGYEAFKKSVEAKSLEKSKTQIKRSKSSGKSVTLHEDDTWLIVVPIDKEASCFHGKNTDWCTTKPFASYFEQYVYDKSIILIYFLNTQTGAKWAIAAHSDTDKIELFDQQDKPITAEQFKQQTGFDPMEYRNRALSSPQVQTQAAAAREIYQAAMKRIQAARPFKQINSQVEQDLMFVKNADLTIEYCTAVKGRWPEAEQWLRNSVDGALLYATEVIGDRWPEGERAILNDPRATMEYSDSFTLETDEETGEVYNTWEAAEAVIAKDPRVAAEYAFSLGRRWKQVEPSIAAHASAAYFYATRILRRRWPEGEAAIKTDADLWSRYAERFNISA